MKRKLMSLFLVLALVFGSVSTAFASTEYNNKLERKPLKIASSIEFDKRAEGISENANVRIIVQVEGAPVIENAIKNGIKVNELEKGIYTTLNKKLVDKQNQVKSNIAKAKIKMKYHNSFTNVVNGFSGTTTLKEAKMIQDISGVEKVTIASVYERPTPLMDTSKGIIRAVETWNTGLNGQGMVVAIIDTGVDPDHKDMKLTDDTKARLDKAKVDANGLLGKYFTAKVPYGYNYMDSNYTILDIGPDASEHGMHVAGTVGANGEIQGVAPEAQLLAMKVFGNDPAMPSTFGDVIVKAIDDSIKLGADVINMSLGSTASFVQPTDPEQEAVKRAVNAGVVCSISAGNSNQMAEGYEKTYGYPLAENPDYGLVGSPGLSTDSIQVASVENTNIKVDALNYEDGKAGYLAAGSFDPVKVFAGKKLGFVDCGLGKVEDFNEKDLNGKIALIMRGSLAFVDKISNAQGAGAAGVIIYNNKSGGDTMISMAYPKDGKIPAVAVGYTDGNKLLSLIAEAKNFVEFKGEKTIVKNPDSGKMSDFTSWGPTPNLDFKPEITAPGGQIYSTLQNNSYGLMSGTSMAAPHVAGGSALVMQRVNKDFSQLTGKAKAEMVKNLMMSTAKPVKDKNGDTLVSPRRQGAGVMDLYAATTTPAIITEKLTGISKVALKQIGNRVEFNVVVTNFSNKELNYNVTGNIQTDLVGSGFNLAMAQPVLNAPMTFEVGGVKVTSVKVPAKGNVELKVKINLTNAVDWNIEQPLKETFPNGTFIDGFITLKEATDNEATLNIPYMGFYGDWNKAPIFDKSIYAEDATSGFYGMTGLAWLKKSGEKESLEFLGFSADGNAINANNIAFAPNGDEYSDSVRPIVSFLRNAKEVEVNILNKDKQVVRRIDSTEYERKNYYGNGKGTFYRTPADWIWDGKVNDEVVEGQYYYQIKAKIDFVGAKWQTLEFPVKVDMTDPVIEKTEFNKENKTITVTAADNMTDIYKYMVYSIAKDGGLGDVLAISTTNVLDISSINNLPFTAVVVAFDYAGNKGLKFIQLGEDAVKPYIFVDDKELEPFGSIASRTISFTGYVEEYAGLKDLKVNGQSIPFTYNKEKDRFEFSHTLHLDRDGIHFVRIEGTDVAGNKIDFERTIYVDTTNPEIQVVTNPKRIVSKDTDSVTFTINAGDNSGDFKVLANGSLVYKHNVDWAYVNKYVATDFLSHTEKDIVITVPLKYGKNVIRIKAIDSFGNETIKTIEVYRRVF